MNLSQTYDYDLAENIINFDIDKTFKHGVVCSNMFEYTQVHFKYDDIYNVLKTKHDNRFSLIKEDMLLHIKDMSNDAYITINDISDNISPNTDYVLLMTNTQSKADITIDISITNDVGNDIKILGLFIPTNYDTLIYRFKTGIGIVTDMNLKINTLSKFEGTDSLRNFAIFKTEDFEKHMICGFEKPNLIIPNDNNLKFIDFKNMINDTVKQYIDMFIPTENMIYSDTTITLRVISDHEYIIKLGCKFFSDKNKNNFIFEKLLFIYEKHTDEEIRLGLLDHDIHMSTLKRLLKSVTTPVNKTSISGDTMIEYYLEIPTSEIYGLIELFRLDIPMKSKTQRITASPDLISNDIEYFDATTIFFISKAASRKVKTPLNVNYKPSIEYEYDSDANTYHRNNPESFVFKNTMLNKIKPIGNITDTFDTYREFYYEIVDKTYVPNIDESHEWFRLYGSTREDAIKNVFAIKRKDKNSMLIVNGIPIQYTSLRLVEYLEHEYIVVNSENDILTLGELHMYNFSTYPSDAALFIHRDGVVNTLPTDGYCIGDYKEVLEFGKGVHYIPDDYVSIGRNYMVVDNSNKIKYYPKEVIYHNKIVIVEDDDTKVFIPIKRSFSMFESAMKLLYTKIGQDINEWNLILDSIDDDIQFMTEFSTKLKFSPNIAELKYIEDQPFYSDIDVFLKNTTVEQNKFIFEEKDLNIINNQDTQLFGKVYTPKILIPVKETSKNILVFMNDKLFRVNPERIDEHHIILDIRDVYDLKEYTITNEFEDIMRWYNMNKTNNVFEVKLYDEEDVILENTFTKDNDNFVPIPLDLVDRNFEVYIDGMYAGTHDDCVLYDYHNMDGFYMTEGATINTKLGLLVNTLNDNRPNIPVLFMKKTSKKYEYSSGSKVVVICTKDPVRAMRVPISGGLVYVHAGIWDDTEFFYSTGTRLMHSDYEQLSSHVIYIKNDFDGFIIIKSRHSYYNKDIIISPDYSISLMETLELEMTPKVINDTLFEMSDDEFDAYCYIVSIAMYLMKNGLSNNSDDFGNIRLWTPVLQSSPLSISGTVNGLNVSMNDIMIQKSMTEVGYTTVVAKISPYVYLEPKEVDDTYMNNLYFYRKVSYILSLYFGEYLSQHKVNKFDISLFDDPTIPNNLVLDVKGEYLSKYNAIFGKVTSVPTFNNLDVTGSLYDIFTLYEVTDRVPVPYGILPLDSFGGSGQKVVNPEAHRLSSFRGNLSVPSNSTITSYLRGKISVYYI